MTAHRTTTGVLGRIWRSLLQASEAAVCISYDAPWARTACRSSNRR